MKKLLTTAMAAGLLASTAAGAWAQDSERERGRGRDRGEAGENRGDRGARGARGDNGGGYNPAMRQSWRNNPGNQAPAQAAPAAAQPQPPSIQADDNRRGRDGGERRERGGDGNRGQRGDDGNRNWQGRDGNRNDGAGAGQRGAERRDWDRGDRNDNRGDNNRWDGRRDWNNGRDNGWSNRDWNRSRPRYDRRAYPPVFQIQRRYRGPVYRPPSGFYVRHWAYGDLLPRGWYTTQYRMLDWFDYGLPIPPIGYDWVRVGDHALLVDTFSGRVVQVVYDLFW